MAIKKNQSSVAVVLNKKGDVIGYLSQRDVNNGADIKLDLLGYTIKAL